MVWVGFQGSMHFTALHPQSDDTAGVSQTEKLYQEALLSFWVPIAPLASLLED